MTQTVVIVKLGRAYDPTVMVGPPLGSGVVYEPKGMTFLPSVSTIPLIVDHNPEREIGRVLGFEVWPWSDQRWIVARCVLDDPPCWLRAGTRASFGSRQLRRYELNGWEVVARVIVDEVSVLIGQAPVEPSAEVLRCYARADDVVAAPANAVIRRPGIGRVLGVR